MDLKNFMRSLSSKKESKTKQEFSRNINGQCYLMLTRPQWKPTCLHTADDCAKFSWRTFWRTASWGVKSVHIVHKLFSVLGVTPPPPPKDPKEQDVSYITTLNHMCGCSKETYTCVWTQGERRLLLWRWLRSECGNDGWVLMHPHGAAIVGSHKDFE